MEFVHAMKDIIKREDAIYRKVLLLEERMSGAILERNGKLMESIAFEEESLLQGLEVIEKERARTVEKHVRDRGMHGTLSGLRIRELVDDRDGASVSLLKSADELKDLLQKIKSLQETNCTMMRDNMELFREMIRGVKGVISEQTGYSERGIERSSLSGSLILDRKI